MNIDADRCAGAAPLRRRRRGALCALRLALALGSVTTLGSFEASASEPAGEALAARAELIVRATCTRAEARWDAASGLVVTDATIAVHEIVAGSAPASLLLSEPGGVLRERNFGMLVPHAARFAPGEESILLLGRDRAGRLRVLGGDRGQLRVERLRPGGPALVDGEDWPRLRARLAALAASRAGRR